MGNCLVTKLKGAVNNSDLEKLGYVSVKAYKFSDAGNLMQISTIEGKTAKFHITDDHTTITEGIGNCTMTDSKNGVIRPKGSATYNGFRVPVNTGDYFEFEVEKYYITNLPHVCDFDISKLKNCISLNNFEGLDKCAGDVSVFKGKNMRIVRFSVISIVGSMHLDVKGDIIDALGACTSLKELILDYTGVDVFTIEDFVTAQRAAGRITTVVDGTDTPISIRVIGNNCKYEDAFIGGSYNLSWTADSISLVKV